jgi:hypothetical protein
MGSRLMAILQSVEASVTDRNAEIVRHFVEAAKYCHS